MYHIFRICLQIHGLRCALLAPRNSWVPIKGFLFDFGFPMVAFDSHLHVRGFAERAPLPGGRGKMPCQTRQNAESSTVGVSFGPFLAWPAWHFGAPRDARR